MRRLSFALAVLSMFACGKDPSTGDDDGTDAGFTGDVYSLKWGPVSVPAGKEATQCIWMRLNNETEIKVHSMHNVLSESSHHLIVYKDDMDTTEQLTPIPCEPFTGALNTTGMVAPIAITQKADDSIFLPDHVAYTFAPHQMVKLEMHYLNSKDVAEDAVATADFFAAEPSTIQHEASILFTGSMDISLPPGQTTTLHQFFAVPQYLDLSQSKIFAMTGHTHALGTSVKVGIGSSKTGPFNPVYAPNPFSWSEPETKTFSEPFGIPVGGGMDFECTWNNTKTTTVTFGESATKEMCFFWAYYYPSQGSKVCIHTDQYNGLNVCCPGDSLCSYIEGML
jgi:hypothetical protein